MDRRIQKTRTSIYSAFSELLEKKSYSKITIQDIIDKANIGRSTFYSHFETKDELINQLCADLFEHITYTIENDKPNSKYSSNEPFIIISHILYHLKENAHNIVPVISSEFSNIFFRFFNEYFEQFIYKHLLDIYKSNINNKNVPTSFLVNHISGSFVNLVQWWVQNDMKESPKNLTNYFNCVIPLKK